MSTHPNPKDRAQLCVKIRVTVAPVSDAGDRITSLLGNLVFDMGQTVGRSRQTSSKANVLLIESVTDALENAPEPAKELDVEFSMLDDDVHLEVRAPEVAPSAASTDEWFPLDKPGLAPHLPATKTMRRKRSELLAEAVQERRVDRAQGGLGLMRLQIETQKLGKKPGNDGSDGGDGGDGGDGSASPAPSVEPGPKKPN